MRISFLHPLSGVCLVVLLSSTISAQSALTGIVRDDSTGRPLPGVEVLLGGTPHAAVTAATGRYLLSDLPAGRHQVIFRIVGFLPARVEVLLTSGDTLTVNQILVPSTVVLDPIQVTGQPVVGLAGVGFDERRRMGFGRFYDAEALREMEHLRLSDVLRRLGGVELHPIHPRRQDYIVALNARYRDALGQPNCYMSVYLDGQLLWRGGNQADGEEQRSNPPPNLKEIVGVNQLVGLEVYESSAAIPIQFGGTSGQCGAVVLWTRRAPDR